MSQKVVSRVSGIAAIGGGILLIVFAIMAAAKPVGCIGQECESRAQRDTSDIDIFLLIGGVLILIGLVGVILRVHAAGRLTLLGKVGAALPVVGVALVILSGPLSARNDELMPIFVIPGIGILLIGLIILGVEILRARVLPVWASWLLIIGAALQIASNSEDARVLLLIPFGVAWIAIGYLLLSTWPTQRGVTA